MNASHRPVGPQHVDRLIEAACQHGEESKPDHEVGDLQDMLRLCWQYMTPEARTSVYLAFSELVDDWLTEEGVA